MQSVVITYPSANFLNLDKSLLRESLYLSIVATTDHHHPPPPPHPSKSHLSK